MRTLWLFLCFALGAQGVGLLAPWWVFGSVTSGRGARRGGRADDHEAPVDVTSFGSDGELPLFKTARRMLLHASPVVALRFSERNQTEEGRTRLGNGTVLAWGYDTSSPFEIRIHTQTYQTLGHPFLRLLVTGVAGDCRIVSRFVKQTALNHTLQYNSFASGAYLARELAEFLQSVAMGDRPLICHAIICSGVDGSVLSVEPSCEVSEVEAVCAGRGAGLGQTLLDREYSANSTLDEALALAKRVINSQPQDGGNSPAPRELGVEFCVVYDDDEVN